MLKKKAWMSKSSCQPNLYSRSRQQAVSYTHLDVYKRQVLDRTHYQNINMTAMIFTKNQEIQEAIMKETGRGVTYWDGAGAYTKTQTRILVTVINKYEEHQIRRIVASFDPNAFVIFNEGPTVSGNFEKRL